MILMETMKRRLSGELNVSNKVRFADAQPPRRREVKVRLLAAALVPPHVC